EIDATTPADVLSEQSRAYVRRLGPVRVGIMRDYPPFSFHDGGKVQGLAVDMLTRVQDLTGLQVIPVTDRWSVLIDLFQRGEIDVMSNISFSPEREAFARFTHPYHVIPNVAFTRRPELRLNSPEDLRGLRIALGNGIYYEAPLRRLFGDDVVAFSSQQSMFAALAEGTVDVVLAALPHGNHWVRELALADVRVAGELQLDGIGGEDLRFAVRPALEPLAGIIDQALQRISPTELRTIEDRWLGAAVEDAGDRTRGADDAAQPIVLNAAEQDYLQSRGHSLSVCVTPNWMPMVGLNQDGLLTGMSFDFLTLFTKRSGIQFEITPLPSLKASLQAMMDRSCDILPLAMKTSERLGYLNFTTPLYVVPSVVLGRRETPFIDDMSELNDKSVGIVRDSAFIELMRTRYPQIRLVMVDNQEDGLRRLQRGDVYAYLGTLLTASHYLQQHRITDIKFIGRAPLDGALAMATRNDHPELAGIAQKLVDSITDQERQAIETNWRTLHVEERIDYRLLWQIVLAALLILSALFFWNRKLKTLNRRLAEANRLLEAHNLIDGLTEIGNRKYFDREFPRNFQQCRRNRLGFMVAMVDIDHFKQVNDTWGHAAGDQCLQQLAACLREHFRRGTDHLARIGGEEFVVFASFEDEDEAKACFEALRQKVEALRIRAGNDTFGFTISIGLYLKKPVSAREASECLKIADEALYEAKRSGRNRCVVHNRLEDPQQRARSEVPG
ncbi:MAG: transporter substrate-binding domain-containing protein, partial [Rhodocyclaceae bacterium]|nr:transporter substrate-binding domain-containing protein [Rhodocyclaceae bacterium]